MKTALQIFFILFTLATFSCTDKSANKEEKAASDTLKAPVAAAPENKVLEKDPRTMGGEKTKEQIMIEEDMKKIAEDTTGLCGYWVGAFGKNKINVALAYTNDKIATGHTVCAGNFRELKGSVKKINDKLYEFNMNEPGDDKYDGSFKFNIDLNSKKLSGSWKPFKNTVGAKNYVLEKREFEYNDTIGDYPTTSNTYLTPEDAQNLLPETAEMMRNEIYARHGYSFQNIKIRRIYDAKDWYMPVSIDIRDDLSALESYNIDFLLHYEDYQGDYYDGYGR
jgi:hypothetical protein